MLVVPHWRAPKPPLGRGTHGVGVVHRRVAHHGRVEGRVGRAGGQPLGRGRRGHARRQDGLVRQMRLIGRPCGGGLAADAQVEPGVPGVVRRLGRVLVLPLAGVLEVGVCSNR